MLNSISSNLDYYRFYDDGPKYSLDFVRESIVPYLGARLFYNDDDTCDCVNGKFGQFSRTYTHGIKYSNIWSIFFDLPEVLEEDQGVSHYELVKKYNNPFGIPSDVPLSMKIEVSGGWFESRSRFEVYDLFLYLALKLGLVPSRIDYAINDYNSLLDIQELYEFAREGNLSRLTSQPTKIETNQSMKIGDVDIVVPANTYYFGGRGRKGNGKYLRVYELLPTHGYPGLRYEVEYQREHVLTFSLALIWTIANRGFIDDYQNAFTSRAFFKEYVNKFVYKEKVPERYSVINEGYHENGKIVWSKVVEESGFVYDYFHLLKDEIYDESVFNLVLDLCDKFLCSVNLGVVDFVDKTNQYSNGSLKNCFRHPHWQYWIDSVLYLDDYGIIPVRIPSISRVRKDVRRNIDWMVRQVFKLFSAIKTGLSSVDFSKFVGMLSAAKFINDKSSLSRNYNDLCYWIADNSDIFLHYFTEQITVRPGFPVSYHHADYVPHFIARPG